MIVEDGTGLANADSYASVAEAVTYFGSRGKADDWDGVDDQEAALVKATDYMEHVYRLRWLSYRTTSVQALSWPRAWVPIPDAPGGYGVGSLATYVPNNVVPTEVKRACMELALRSASAELAPDLDRKVLSETVGPLSTQYDPSSPPYKIYRDVDMMLSSLLHGSGRLAATVVRT